MLNKAQSNQPAFGKTMTSNNVINNATKNIATVTVTEKTTWTPMLFSFKVTRPSSFKFTAGQFVRLGVVPELLAFYRQGADTDNPDSNSIDIGNVDIESESIFRAYSIVSSPYDEFLEFFSVVIPDGEFTSNLQHLQVGDTLLLNTTPFGFLTLARYQKPDPQDLWLLATGTGVAPFLSMLQDPDTWQSYRQIVLAYSVRTRAELAYADAIPKIARQFQELVDTPAKFVFVPIITREPSVTVSEKSDSASIIISSTLHERLPKLLSGLLQQTAGVDMNATHSHIMLCGNPQMVEDTKETLKEMGYAMNRRGEGNIAVENYW